MNYPQSQEIIDLITKSKRILLNCHRNPDADSVGSSTALWRYLSTLGKEVTILTPNEIPDHLQFLAQGAPVVIAEFDTFDFSPFDLAIITDTSNWGRVYNSSNSVAPLIPVVVVDNHETNHGFGTLNLLDYHTSSAAEMVYRLLEDWGVEVTKDMAQSLLAGIIGDTGSFQFEIYDRTFEIAQTLMHKGADIKTINFHLFNSVSLPLVKFWGKVIDAIQIDETGFVWSALPFEKYEEFSHLKGTRETASSMIMRKIEGTKFGFVMTEDMPRVFSISLRSREDVDVATIAATLGGGGHPGAAGARIENKSYDEALAQLLTLCREFALK